MAKLGNVIYPYLSIAVITVSRLALVYYTLLAYDTTLPEKIPLKFK